MNYASRELHEDLRAGAGSRPLGAAQLCPGTAADIVIKLAGRIDSRGVTSDDETD